MDESKEELELVLLLLNPHDWKALSILLSGNSIELFEHMFEDRRCSGEEESSEREVVAVDGADDDICLCVDFEAGRGEKRGHRGVG